jgi:hypothetical protein
MQGMNMIFDKEAVDDSEDYGKFVHAKELMKIGIDHYIFN